MGSDPRVYKESLVVAREYRSVIGSSEFARDCEYKGVQQNESQLSVGENHGELVVEEELEVNL
jgi:hypothetical protein